MGSLIVFSALSWGITAIFGPEPIVKTIPGSGAWYGQIGIGLLLGAVWGSLAWMIVSRPFFTDIRNFFKGIFEPMNLGVTEVVFISICAGVGEELLFRGAIQPLIGIWLTALLFVAIHGYLNPFNWRMSVFGGLMVLAAASFGYATIHWGIISAIVAHTVVDIILLLRLRQPVKTITRAEIPSE